MKILPTYISGPSYITRDSMASSGGIVSQEQEKNYTAGVISHEVDKIKKVISSGSKSQTSTNLVAPSIQLSPRVFQQLSRFTRDLEPFLVLKDGWNGGDSKRPSEHSIEQAILTCFSLVQSGLNAPKPKVFSTGSLGCFWRVGHKYATIDFEEDGEHIWTVTDGKIYKTGTWKSGEVVPKAIDSTTTSQES